MNCGQIIITLIYYFYPHSPPRQVHTQSLAIVGTSGREGWVRACPQMWTEEAEGPQNASRM